MCERIDNMYAIVDKEERRALQLRYITGFLTAFKGRLNRVCEKPYKKFDFDLINQKYPPKDENKLRFIGEENFFGEKINSPEEFIEDICNLIDIVYASAMEEEKEMEKLAYLISAIIGLKSKLNRVCGKI